MRQALAALWTVILLSGWMVVGAADALADTNNDGSYLQTTNPVGAISEDGLWWALEDRGAPRSLTSALAGAGGRTFWLNRATLFDVFASAPLQFTRSVREMASVMTLPMPDGTFSRFRIEESPILSAELEARFPRILTYRGQGLDDADATARLDVTPWGFHAQVISQNGTVLVDPVDPADAEVYRSIWKHDVERGDFQCRVDEMADFPIDEAVLRVLRLATNPSGDRLRTYRLAITATGEYTQFFAGPACPPGSPAACPVNAAAAQIVTTVNRVTGIYEREVSISFSLTATNIYEDPGADPFTDGSTVNNTLLGENQTDLDTNVGSANYDIGHIFGQGGGGGLAQGRACNGSNKARGGTSLGNPSGDVFDVDFVSHEIGHQLAGSHTWNGDSGSCSAGQWVSHSAYEPGSGSTIMAYAGICAGQNVQPNSDPYFHTRSFDQITAYRDGGGACGTEVVTGNTVPTVNAGADYTIPRDTPFTLTASGSDADGHALTYAWEQYDLGTRDGNPQSTFTQGPLFRSRLATADPSRTLPQFADILSGAPTPWEVLPTVDRTLTFRATVRDNQAGGGGVDHDTMVVTVSGGPFFIVSPDAGDTLQCGDSETLEWNVGGGSVASDVRALVSDDGGASFTTLLASTPNDGSQAFTAPTTLTGTGRVKLEAVGNIFFDVSEEFSIADTLDPVVTAPANLSDVECTSPAGASPDLGTASATDLCDVSLVLANDAPADFPLGTTTVTWTATDDSDNTGSDIQTVTVVDTTAPVLTAPADLTVECTSPAGTPVTLGTPTASDVCDAGLDIVNDAPGLFSLGTTPVLWTATDDSGNSDSDIQVVTVEDTTPPDFEISVTPDLLWPANHKLVPILVEVTTLADGCDATPTVRLVSISSNEADNGRGDGNTVGDIQGAFFGTDDRDFLLRAERSGRGEGRDYTITYVAEDASGNQTFREVTVSVPKNRSISLR